MNVTIERLKDTSQNILDAIVITDVEKGVSVEVSGEQWRSFIEDEKSQYDKQLGVRNEAFDFLREALQGNDKHQAAQAADIILRNTYSV